MALTTLSAVLARLGLDDDSVTETAIAISVVSPLTSCAFAVSGTTLTVTPSSGGPTAIDLTLAANDTMGELASVLDAMSGIMATVVSGSAVSSALLVDQSINVTTSALGQLQYAPTGEDAGTNATAISQLISETDYAIARYCGRDVDTTGADTFSIAARDEYYNGDGEEVLLLKNYPVTAVTSVKLVAYDGTESTVASTGYRLNAEKTGLHWAGSGLGMRTHDPDGFPLDLSGGVMVREGWPCGVANIRVAYTAGYAVIPYDLQGVSTDIVCEAFLNRRTNTKLASEGKGGGRSVSFKSIDEIARQHHHRLAPYRSLVNR